MKIERFEDIEARKATNREPWTWQPE